jgi:hypothetical protein
MPLLGVTSNLSHDTVTGNQERYIWVILGSLYGDMRAHRVVHSRVIVHGLGHSRPSTLKGKNVFTPLLHQPLHLLASNSSIY